MDPGDVWREMDGIWMVNGLTLCELENGPVEIVSFPSYKMVDFPLLCESLPEVNPIKSHSTTINKLTKPPFSYGFPIK